MVGPHFCSGVQVQGLGAGPQLQGVPQYGLAALSSAGAGCACGAGAGLSQQPGLPGVGSHLQTGEQVHSGVSVATGAGEGGGVGAAVVGPHLCSGVQVQGLGAGPQLQGVAQ